MITQIHRRSYYAPFMHVAWIAIAAGGLWRVKGANPFPVGMILDPRFLLTFFVPFCCTCSGTRPCCDSRARWA